MKKLLLTLTFILAVTTIYAQNNWFWYNPFPCSYTSIDGNTENTVGFTTDSSGQIWFYANNFLGSEFYVMNQGATIIDSLEGLHGSATFDQRNRLWIDFTGLYTDTGFAQLPWPPQANNGYTGLGMAWDNSGNDYFLTEYIETLPGIDSFFLLKWDGSTFQTTYLNSLGIPFNDSTVEVLYMVNDHAGAIYINCKEYGFMKYYQGNWTHITTVIDTSYQFLKFDKNNNMLFYGPDSSAYLIKTNGISVDSIPWPSFCPYSYSALSLGFTTGPDGNLWNLTDQSGFFDLMPNNAWNYVGTPGFLNRTNILLCESGTSLSSPGIFDKQGRLWMSGNDNPSPAVLGAYSFTPFNSITGRVFFDSAGTGIATTADPGFTALNIVQSTNGYYTNTDTNGNYSIVYLDSTETHVVSATAPQYYHLTSPSSYSVAPGDSLCCYNFGLLTNGNIQDLQITVASMLRGPGYSSMAWLNYQNTGTITVSDTITYIFDTLLTYQQAWPAPIAISGNKLSWAYQNLRPFDINSITIEFILDSTAVVGDTLTSIAAVQPIATDTTPGNNVYVNTQLVYSSFDPNLKTVSPSINAVPGQELTYTIYFQNTGTAPAVNIVVLDTLDLNLNPATFRFLGSSSPVKVGLQGQGIISFTFSNINLPDSSTSAVLSCGFVQFAVSIANPPNEPGQSIDNVASITFDFNSPVQTNTAITSFHNTVGLLTPSSNTDLLLKLFPNPGNEKVLVVIDASNPEGTLTVYDAIGNRVLSQTLTSAITTLNASEFASGVYFVQAITKEGVIESAKLVKP